MKQRICLLSLSILFLLTLSFHAAQKAVTELGDVVILNDDGTWFYEDQTKDTGEIPENEEPFIRPEDATFCLKSRVNQSQYWFNPKEWSFTRTEGDGASEYQFQLRGKDLYAMVVNEAVQVQMKNLVEIALENARSVAPDARVIHREYRTVNGNRVIYQEMQGTMQGIQFTYMGYYHSDESGSTQYLVYTGSSLIDTFRQEIFDFLNGFTVGSES